MLSDIKVAKNMIKVFFLCFVIVVGERLKKCRFAPTPGSKKHVSIPLVLIEKSNIRRLVYGNDIMERSDFFEASLRGKTCRCIRLEDTIRNCKEKRQVTAYIPRLHFGLID